MTSVLDAFHPAVRSWFGRRFEAASRAQELGWPIIGGGLDALLCAPTGSGKTLAAFLWSINTLVVQAQAGALSDEVSVLYVSPLKALANDIRLNLEEPLDGVRQAAAEMGVNLAPIRAGLRTGDTPAYERSAMLRRPPHILVTTPESLFILLTSARFREKLAAVRYVIVDELHAVAGNKRGAHLTVTLERLERLVRGASGARPVRIGLSATLNPIESLAAFLCGAEISDSGERVPRACRVVRAEDRPRTMDLQVVAPGPELGPLTTHPHWEAMYDSIAELIRNHRTTLVFTLSRRLDERVALNLQKRLGTDAVMAHHGSLARRERLEAEQRLKRGELKAIVATSSLELGIDVGAVELVCQIDSPKSISAAIQRVGRSGHALAATPKGRLFAMTLDDLIECGAAVRAIRKGRIDRVEIPRGCLDVAAQQIVAIAAEEGEIRESELLKLLRAADNFSDLGQTQLRALLDELATPLAERISGAYPKIFHDRTNRLVGARRGARLAVITSGGTIPESGNYDVVIESSGRKIGDVEEDFAQESVRGDVFSLGSMPWQILRISRGRLMVEAAPGMAPSLPFWQTEANGRTAALSEEVADLKKEIAARLDDPAGAAAWLGAECAIEERAAVQAIDHVRRGVLALGAIPDEHTIIAERFFDGLGGTQIVIHTALGIRFNRGLGLALRKRLCQSFNFEIQASAIDDGVLLALNSRHSFPLQDIFNLINARTVRDVLTQALLDAPMFEVRFRHVATRALTVMRNSKGRKVPAWIQRLRAQDLIVALFPQQQACFENRPPRVEMPDRFVVRETIRECLEEATDLPRLEELLRGMDNGSVRTLTVDSISPSVFAQRLLLAWDYSFLDDGERANRRSRTVTMNRGMAEEVFRKEDLSQLLSDSAVAQVEAEVQGTAASRRARNEHELFELIRAHGALRPAALGELVTGDSATMVQQLSIKGRVVRARLKPDGFEVLIACEDLALFSATYPEIELVGAILESPAEPAERVPAEEAGTEIVRRALKTSAPVTARQLAQRLQLEEREITNSLSALEASGAVFRGHFTSAACEQWCDRYNLERIHRITLTRLRAETEPCEDHEFAAFRLRWFHIGAAGVENDAEGLATVLAQLAGLAFKPSFWERSIIPARIADARAEMVDQLCLGGRLIWIGTPKEGIEEDLPERVCFMSRSQAAFLLPGSESQEIKGEHEQATLKALLERGAQYLDQLADGAGISERDALRALWRLAARGMVTNDSFGPLRLLSSDADAQRALNPEARGHLSRRDAAMRAKVRSALAGRWSVIGQGGQPGSRHGQNGAAGDREPEQLALLILERNGILTREMLAMESLALNWQELVFTLRRLEYSGRIRRGYFVKSLTGEQYALPAALDALAAVRRMNWAREPALAMSAADPANPYGALLKTCGVAREESNLIVVRAGKVVAGLQGRELTTADCDDSESFSAAMAALMRFRPKLAITTVDGVPALESNRVGMMAAMRFHSDGHALIYDGLPGPAPARAKQ